ncbi:MAG: hypothetical protein ACI9GZ_002328 [Bacteroidia bacterium]|jgi:hypothetical protein
MINPLNTAIMRNIIYTTVNILVAASCAAKKEFIALQSNYRTLENELQTVR